MTGLPDRCHRCLCSECNGTTEQHTGGRCICPECAPYPEYACTAFTPPALISYLAEQLAPLLSAHLGPRQKRRCVAVAHAAHHALHDYDHPGDTR